MGLIVALFWAFLATAIALTFALGSILMRLNRNVESAKQENRELTRQCEALLFLTQVLQAQLNHLQQPAAVVDNYRALLRSQGSIN